MVARTVRLEAGIRVPLVRRVAVAGVLDRTADERGGEDHAVFVVQLEPDGPAGHMSSDQDPTPPLRVGFARSALPMSAPGLPTPGVRCCAGRSADGHEPRRSGPRSSQRWYRP